MNPSIPKSEHLEWMGEFYNDNLAFDHYEILMINHIPLKDRKVETELMTTKWFDYRLMHPMYATFHFFDLFVKEYQAYIAKNINIESAPFIYPFKGEAKRNFLKAKEGLTIWRLRQKADMLGIRYDFFLKVAFNKIYTMKAGGRVVPPRPSQLSSEDLLAEILLSWQAMCKAGLQIACSPYFRVSNFNHSLIQRDHERFALAQVAQRSVPHYSLACCLYEFEVVRIEAAMQQFDQHTLSMAINHSIEF